MAGPGRAAGTGLALIGNAFILQQNPMKTEKP
ncbi:MAG: hypothetical protein V7633_4323 [Pseudonocardia sp.]|jgi:hypothetical protein